VSRHYAIETDGSPEAARALAAACERMLAIYERLLPPADPAAFERDVARAPFVLFRVEDERRFRDASHEHGAGAVEGFFCEEGGECVIGPGQVRRIAAGRAARGAFQTQEFVTEDLVEMSSAVGAGQNLSVSQASLPNTNQTAQARRSDEVAVRSLPAEPRDLLAWAGANDVHVLYHEGFHQYLARLGARGLDVPFAEGLAEWFARRAAREPGEPFAAERAAIARRELARAAEDVVARGTVLEAGPGLANARPASLGVSLDSYGVYGLWIEFLEEGEGGRLRPRLDAALARAIAGGPADVDLTGLFDGEAALEAAFRAFAHAILER
jgi:hypothetical protein